MDIKTFQKASFLIASSFPDRKFEAEVYYELLKDLQDEPFLKAVVDFCKTQKELYPGSNLIAILRERTNDVVKRGSILLTLPEGERWTSPTQEWKDLIKKLSEEKSGV